MLGYVLLIMYGILCIGFTWSFSRDIIGIASHATDLKYDEIRKKFLPFTTMSMVLFGYMFLHSLAHFGELTF